MFNHTFLARLFLIGLSVVGIYTTISETSPADVSLIILHLVTDVMSWVWDDAGVPCFNTLLLRISFVWCVNVGSHFTPVSELRPKNPPSFAIHIRCFGTKCVVRKCLTHFQSRCVCTQRWVQIEKRYPVKSPRNDTQQGGSRSFSNDLEIQSVGYECHVGVPLVALVSQLFPSPRCYNLSAAGGSVLSVA